MVSSRPSKFEILSGCLYHLLNFALLWAMLTVRAAYFVPWVDAHVHTQREKACTFNMPQAHCCTTTVVTHAPEIKLISGVVRFYSNRPLRILVCWLGFSSTEQKMQGHLPACGHLLLTMLWTMDMETEFKGFLIFGILSLLTCQGRWYLYMTAVSWPLCQVVFHAEYIACMYVITLELSS